MAQRPIITLNEQWCKSCGICVQICPAHVFSSQDITGKVVIQNPDDCTGCGLCQIMCPDYVISLENEDDV